MESSKKSSFLNDEEKKAVKYILSIRDNIEDAEDIFPDIDELRENIGIEAASMFEERTFHIWKKYERILQDSCAILINPDDHATVIKLMEESMKLETNYYSIVVDYLIFSIKTLIDEEYSNKDLFVKFKELEKKYGKIIREKEKEFKFDQLASIKKLLDEFHALFFEFEGLKQDILKERREKSKESTKWKIGLIIAIIGLIITIIGLIISIYAF